MIAGITTRGRFGCPARYPGPGVPSVAGPIVTLGFTLELAGPVPSTLPTAPPQQCQNSTPNVALQVAVVDQGGNPVNLQGATSMLLWLLAPDGTARAVPAAFVSNGLDGLVQYVTTAQDLNEAGLWQIQAQMTFGTQVLRTARGEFCAGANIGG